MAIRAVLDACVLYPPSLRDLLLSLAVADLFQACWTDRIQDEWMRAVTASQPHLAPSLGRTRHLMEAAVPGATVTGYERLAARVDLPDPDDRHVLGAAIAAKANVIVTLNLKDFPDAVLAPFRIAARHPDVFVARLLTRAPRTALLAVQSMRARLRAPAFTPDAFVELFARQGLTRTAAILRAHITSI
jgi:predicted nucleic acid-binding protein